MKELLDTLMVLYPSIPLWHARRAVEFALRPDRVGQKTTLSVPQRVERAVMAWVRHEFTDYDKLRGQGVSKEEARFRTQTACEAILQRWRVRPARPVLRLGQ
jgi:hypothetical protein